MPKEQLSLLLTSSAAASPAKTSASPDAAKVSTESEAGSGSRCSGRSKRRSRAWSWSKTYWRSLHEGWTRLSTGSSVPATSSKGGSLPRPTSARRICVGEFSSWPTPLASEAKRGQKEKRTRKEGMTLGEAVRKWPTPVTTDAKGARRATARAEDWESNDGVTLTDAVRMFPTPTATTYGTRNNGDPGDGRGEYATKGAPSLETMARTGELTNPNATTLRERLANPDMFGPLNPDWVETLMGFSIGWTDGPLDPATLLLFGNLEE